MKKRIIQLNWYFLFLAFLLCILSSIIEGMRFGAISLFFMSVTGGVFFIIDNSKFNVKIKSIIILIFLIICSLPLLHNAQNDARWSSLIETIPIALDTENNSYWMGDNTKIPSLANGEIVKPSNYMRIAWASKAVEYISNDIFGIGYGKNIFGHAIEKYEEAPESVRGSHSHSAIIDFTIGVGLLGLVIWLSFIIKIILSSAKLFINSGNYFALLSVFLTSGFMLRSIVDSNMRDHMFKQFFLILGIALTLSIYENNKNKNIS